MTPARLWSEAEKSRLLESRKRDIRLTWAEFQKRHFPERTINAVQSAYGIYSRAEKEPKQMVAQNKPSPASSMGKKRPITRSGSPESCGDPKKTKTVCGFDDFSEDEDESSNQLFVEEQTFVKAQNSDKRDTTKTTKAVSPPLTDRSSVNNAGMPDLPEDIRIFERIINAFKSQRQTLMDTETKLKEVEGELKALKMSSMIDRGQSQVTVNELTEEVSNLKRELLQVKTEKEDMTPDKKDNCERCAQLEGQLNQIVANFRPLQN
ncbi:uncharacterized protein BP01DRAFT_381179 [Aspergillus saccharolyticus JOP 1030-1]|uniref:Myb-like domain-containing protein n=1 Tax=Aspergillus saccharolyticus JOP 1030-1 TaxID=1450539 RepID=A0A318ZH07_9EURO|nr:hypothetical protein BP01DRAFT_381179 [Aspergillus saccharolyticus JOP 1030-1]PYH46749.1 hypothetical protein BP01DRAFT_381179 [Aspergillus saccharolyticus JOP 1030-1]